MRTALAAVSLLLVVLTAGCRGPFTFVKAVHDVGRQEECCAYDEEVRFDDAARRLEISYKAIGFNGSLVPRALVVPYDSLQFFRLGWLSMSHRDLVWVVRGINPPNETVARFLVIGEVRARDAQRRVNVLRMGSTSLSRSRAQAALEALRRGQAVKMPDGKILVPYNDEVYGFRLPYREENRPWAVPARVALYPFALAGDIVVLPLQVLAFVVVWGPVMVLGGI